jgi:hypothetical protein
VLLNRRFRVLQSGNKQQGSSTAAIYFNFQDGPFRNMNRLSAAVRRHALLSMSNMMVPLSVGNQCNDAFLFFTKN